MMTFFSDLATYLGVPVESLGHLIGGTGVFLGALIALWTARNITGKYYEAQRQEWERQRNQRISDTFRQLHQQIWETQQIVKVRRCIVNDREYDDYLKPVLEARNRTERNMLSSAENDVIEALDRYLATILRLKMFIDQENLNKAQAESWNRLLWQNFGERVKEDRDELKVYIERHWGSGLLEPPNFFERIKKIIYPAS